MIWTRPDVHFLLPAAGMLFAGVFGRGRPRLAGALAFLVGGASFLAAVGAVWSGPAAWALRESAGDAVSALGFGGVGAGLPVTVVTAAVVLMVVVYRMGAAYSEPGQGRFYALVFGAAAAVNGALFSKDLLSLVVFVEAAYSCMFLAVEWSAGKRREVREGGFWPVQAAGLLLGGAAVAVLLGRCGSLRFDAVGEWLSSGGGMAAVVVKTLLLGWAAMRSALFPFHAWLRDVIAGGRKGAGAVFAAGVLSLGLFLLSRVAVLAGGGTVSVMLAAAGAATVVRGGVVPSAVGLRGMLGGVVLSQIGLGGMVLGVTGWSRSGAVSASGAVLLHSAAASLAAAGLFIACGEMERLNGAVVMDRPRMVRPGNPLFVLGALGALLSLAGAPPLLGFWDRILMAGVFGGEGGGAAGVLLCGVFLVPVVQSARLWRVFAGGGKRNGSVSDTPAGVWVPVFVLGAALLLGGAAWVSFYGSLFGPAGGVLGR